MGCVNSKVEKKWSLEHGKLYYNNDLISDELYQNYFMDYNGDIIDDNCELNISDSKKGCIVKFLDPLIDSSRYTKYQIFLLTEQGTIQRKYMPGLEYKIKDMMFMPGTEYIIYVDLHDVNMVPIQNLPNERMRSLDLFNNYKLYETDENITIDNCHMINKNYMLIIAKMENTSDYLYDIYNIKNKTNYSLILPCSLQIKYNKNGLTINGDFYKFTDIEKRHGRIKEKLNKKMK